MVLLPGLQGDPSVFAPLVAHLDGLEVWGGRLSRGGLSIDAACLEARLVRQGIERPRVVCGSYGGQVALRSSQYFQSLVLTGSFGNWTQLSRRQRLMLRASLRAPSAVLEDRYRAKRLSDWSLMVCPSTRPNPYRPPRRCAEGATQKPNETDRASTSSADTLVGRTRRSPGSLVRPSDQERLVGSRDTPGTRESPSLCLTPRRVRGMPEAVVELSRCLQSRHWPHLRRVR